MAKESYYFKHDRNARNDIKVVKLRRKYKLEGYGAFFALLEILSEQDEYKLPVTDIGDLAYDLSISEKKLNSIINDFGLFKIEDGFFYSGSLLFKMEMFEEGKARRRAAGRAGGLSNAKAMLERRTSKPEAIEKIKEEEITEKEIKEDNNNYNKEKREEYIKTDNNNKEKTDKIQHWQAFIAGGADVSGLKPLNALIADVMADNGYVGAITAAGIREDHIQGWMQAFNRKLVFSGDTHKTEKEYRIYFGNWLMKLPPDVISLGPARYSPVAKPPVKAEINTGDEKIKALLRKSRTPETR